MNTSSKPVRCPYVAPTVQIVLLSAHDMINSSYDAAALAEVYNDAEFADGAFAGRTHFFDEGNK